MNVYRLMINPLGRRFLLIFLFLSAAIPVLAATDRGAEACYRRIDAGLEGLQAQLPAITRSAERAAAGFVKNDFGIVVFGDPGMVGEATGRAGGLMPIDSGNLKTADGKNTIALFFPYPPGQNEMLKMAATMRKNGGIIVVFGDAALKDAAEKAGIPMDCFIATTCPVENAAAGRGKIGFPSDAVMNMSALWCWTGEFVAACTRLGRMPPLYQSFAVPGARDRAAKFQGLKFHAETPTPIAAGIFGKQYLDGIRQHLSVLHEKELDHIRTVAGQAVAAADSGHAVYLSVIGHALVGHAPRIKEDGRMQLLNDGWSSFRKDLKLNRGDFVFFLGYDDMVPELAGAAQQAGAVSAWSFTDYKTAPGAVPAGQVVINQRWALGDAIIAVPNYDIRILPPSGVIAETILGMILAEMDSPRYSGLRQK